MWILMAAIACGAAVAYFGLATRADTATVSFQSATYDDFRRVLARQSTGAVTIKAQLAYPEQVRERYPAVIVVHGLGGYRDAHEGAIAAELRKIGFATLTYDSFAARRITGSSLSAAPGYLPAGVADAYAALRFLSGEPRIDNARIAVIGFSYGGDVAHLTALEVLRGALNAGPVRFAAHVAFYPGGNFGAIADGHAYTGAPVRMLLGGKDDNLPIAKIENYLAYARARGAAVPITTVIYPGAYHAWTASDLPTARFYPELVSTKKCPIILVGQPRSALLVESEVKPLDPAVIGACLAAAPGYWMGFDAAVRSRSMNDTVRFLQENLKP
jgi:dienelactone hydrolase